MSDVAEPSSVVNTFTPILDVDSRGAFVRLPGARILRLHDTVFSRWYLRSRFKKMEATEAGKHWFSNTGPLNLLSTTLMKTKPREYQEIGLIRMLIDPMSLFFDMGLGKTFMILYHCMALFEHQNKNYFLIVCPHTLFLEWKEQIQKHITISADCQTFVLHGTKLKKEAANLRCANTAKPIFIFTSYHTLKNVSKILETLPISLFAADEASRMRYMKTAITKEIHALGQKLPNAFKIPLSGTPSTTEVEGYFSLYEWSRPGCTGFPSSFMFQKHFQKHKQFLVTKIDGEEKHVFYEKKEEWLARNYPKNSMKTYAELGYTFELQSRNPLALPIIRVYTKFDSIQNATQLQALTERNAYARKKEEVLPELPAKIYIVRQVEMSDEQRRAYHEILTTCRTELEDKVFSFSNQNSPFAKLHQIANGYLKKGDDIYWFKEQPKLEALDTLLDEAGEEQVIVWAPFIPLIDRLHRHILDRGATVGKMYGNTTNKERDAIITAFKQKQLQYIVANPAVMGLGYNLAMSYIQAWITNWFKPDERSQAEDRQHRIGQENGVMIYDFPSIGTIERKILKTLQKKIEIEDQILSIKDLIGDIG